MADLFISGIDQKLLDKFTNRLNKLRSGGAKKGDKSKYAIEAIKQWLDAQGRIVITIDSGQVQEVYETLCSIPNEITAMTDYDPSTARHPAIEAMINQLEARMRKL